MKTKDILTLRFEDEEKELSEWGLEAQTIHFENQSDDYVLLQNMNPLEDKLEIPTHAEVELFLNNKPFFHGHVSKYQTTMEAGKQVTLMYVSGPWWYLKTLAYQQHWPVSEHKTILNSRGNPASRRFKKEQKLKIGDFTVTGHVLGKNPGDMTEPHTHNDTEISYQQCSRIVLGQSTLGQRLNTKQQLEHIFAFAQRSGAPLRVGSINVEAEFPMDEVRDVTCAQAIRRVLRWHPDAVCWFDYTKGFPEVNVDNIASLQQKIIGVEEPSLRSITISPRKDRAVSQVNIHFERIYYSQGMRRRYVQMDCYPRPTGVASRPGELSFTIQIDPPDRSQLTSKEAPQFIPIKLNREDWWRKNVPELAKLKGYKLDQVVRSGKQNHTHILAYGKLSPEMQIPWERETITATFLRKTERNTVHCRIVDLTVISATPKRALTLGTLINHPDGVVPTGLAKTLYKALAHMHYEGHVDMHESPEVEQYGLGQRISFRGGPAEWLNMMGIVQSMTVDVGLQKRTLRLGPPRHWGQADLGELLRISRNQEAPQSAALFSGLDDAKEVASPSWTTKIHNPKDRTCLILSRDPNNPDGPNALPMICLDIDDLPKGRRLYLKLREITVCENGEPKRMIVLASSPY